MEQLDLFAPTRKSVAVNSDDDRAGWERRALEDMRAGPLVCCFPGFMGAVCERLVAKGLAVREDAGFMGPPMDLDGKPIKWPKGWRADDHPQYRYSAVSA